MLNANHRNTKVKKCLDYRESRSDGTRFLFAVTSWAGSDCVECRRASSYIIWQCKKTVACIHRSRKSAYML